MTPDGGRIIGLGVALVDCIYNNSQEVPPGNREGIPGFVSRQEPDLIRAGGPMPNTMSSMARFAVNRGIKLFHCVGDDSRGRLFRHATEPFVGPAQVDPNESTGIWLGLKDGKGSLKFSLSYYGAALNVKISKEDLGTQSNGVFVTDISSCKYPSIHDQTEDVLGVVAKDQGIFVLSLGGARPSSVSSIQTASIVNSFKRPPDVVFSNEQEFKHACGQPDMTSAIGSMFPNARLVMVTRGGSGVVGRFEGQIFNLPAKLAKKVEDEVGAGDAFMGTMLGQLLNRPYSSWKAEDIEKSADVASYAASLVVQSPHVRLSDQQTELIRRYIQNG